MLAGEGLFRTEYRSDFEDPFKSACHCHLLIELGALRKISLAVKIIHLENVRAALACRADKLRGMYLDEIVVDKISSHRVDEAGLNLEQQLIFIGTQIYPAVVQPLVDRRTLDSLLFLGSRYLLANYRQWVGNGFNDKLGGQNLDAAQLDILIFTDAADNGNDAVRGDPGKLIEQPGTFFLFHGHLYLAGDVLYHDKSHALAVTEVFNKALNLGACAGLGLDITD